jgi:probable HAF family extracellular repeat protein
MLRRCTMILCAFGLVVSCAGVVSATTYTFFDLSASTTDTGSYAYGINNNNVVTGRAQPGQTHGQAFVWSVPAGRTILPTLAGTATGAGYAINDSGMVTGLSAALSPTSNRAWRRATQNTLANLADDVAIDVGLKVAGSTSSRGMAINSAGAVVGYGSIGGVSTGFYWDGVSASAQIIYAPPGGSNAGWLNAGINDSGLCVGYNQVGGDHSTIFHPGDATATDINPQIKAVLVPTDDMSSRALGVNNAGQIVGYFQPGMNVEGKPYLYNDSTHIYDLGSAMTWGSGMGHAHAINSTGTVVGYGRLNDGNYHAFVWTPTTPNGTTGTMVDLNSLGFVVPSGYYLQQAWSVNNAGSIVGQMFNGTAYRAFALIAVPEPSTLLLAASGLVGLLVYAWRKRR